jgi:hypothetical protein
MSNREKNIQHELRELNRVRPKQPEYQFAELEQIVAGWARKSVAEKQQQNG